MNSSEGTNAAPGDTYAGAISELESLGVVFGGFDPTAPYEGKPYAIKLLAKYDPEMLHRIMNAVRNTDEPFRGMWARTLGGITLKDITKRGKNIATSELARIMPQFERLLAINPLDAALLNVDPKEYEYRGFWNLTRASYIEKQTGISPGDTGYAFVQASLIHVAITRPKKFDVDDVQPYLQKHHADIAFIAENINGTLGILRELHVRKDGSREAVELMLGLSPSLAEGAL